MTKVRPPALARFAARAFRPPTRTAGFSIGLLLLGGCGGASKGGFDPGADDGGSGRRVSRVHTAELTWEAYSDLQRSPTNLPGVPRASLNPARIFIAILGASGERPMSFPHFHVRPVYETDERARAAFVFLVGGRARLHGRRGPPAGW